MYENAEGEGYKGCIKMLRGGEGYKGCMKMLTLLRIKPHNQAIYVDYRLKQSIH